LKAPHTSKVFIFLIFIVFTTNTVTLFNALKKDDFGNTEDISLLEKDVSDIKSILPKYGTIGYLFDGKMSFDDLAKYYQLRFLIAPINLSLNYSKIDTLVYYEYNNQQRGNRPGSLTVEDFELLKKSHHNSIYILTR